MAVCLVKVNVLQWKLVEASMDLLPWKLYGNTFTYMDVIWNYVYLQGSILLPCLPCKYFGSKFYWD